MVGARLANLQKGGAGGFKTDSALAPSPPISQKEAAELLNIGVDTIKTNSAKAPFVSQKQAGESGERAIRPAQISTAEEIALKRQFQPKSKPPHERIPARYGRGEAGESAKRG
jgi:hypothetical protein